MNTTIDSIQMQEENVLLQTDLHELSANELELIQSNEDKLKLISIISHDLRNPINTILGLSELLERKVQLNDLESIEAYAKNINKSTQKIRTLLSNLLEWSISLSGKIEFRPVAIKLKGILNEVTELFEETLKLKSLSIQCDCPDDMEVLIDKEMISTVLRNIISNSIKFSYPGATIHIQCVRKEDKVSISIRDQGIGMSDKTISRLFKVGKLQTNKGTKAEAGSGIGLMLCKDFLQKHQSEVTVESEEGKGSTFKFSLPVVPRY